jgi:hypothetical protein
MVADLMTLDPVVLGVDNRPAGRALARFPGDLAKHCIPTRSSMRSAPTNGASCRGPSMLQAEPIDRLAQAARS